LQVDKVLGGRRQAPRVPRALPHIAGGDRRAIPPTPAQPCAPAPTLRPWAAAWAS